MNSEFRVGQLFFGTYPPQAAAWCNNNDLMIVENESSPITVTYKFLFGLIQIKRVKMVRCFEIKRAE